MMTDATDEPLAIAEYGQIGDCRTAALVGRNGAVDWLCWPRFDSAACFGALLGDARRGRWRIAPVDAATSVTRRYSGETLILETRFETAEGRVALIDFMPVGGDASSVVRIVERREGRVPMRLHLTLRFDYGSSVPWVTRLEDGSGVVAVSHLALVPTALGLYEAAPPRQRIERRGPGADAVRTTRAWTVKGTRIVRQAPG
jgi:GH15 family glucan-1,4-alpha-glucosidase